jgi:hypothetical protein
VPLTLLKVLLVRVDELEGSQLEATSLKPRDDVANDAALDTVGLSTVPSTNARIGAGVGMNVP